jgi:hypothetical protein
VVSKNYYPLKNGMILAIYCFATSGVAVLLLLRPGGRGHVIALLLVMVIRARHPFIRLES